METDEYFFEGLEEAALWECQSFVGILALRRLETGTILFKISI